MKTEIYNNLFSRLSELGAIRKDLSLGCKVWEIYTYIWSEHYEWMDAAGFLHDDISDDDEVKWHPPELSDCLNCVYNTISDDEFYSDSTPHCEWISRWEAEKIIDLWDLSKPYLHQQSDETGEKLFTLLK